MTGEKLAMLRKAAGLTQADLAGLLGVHPKSVQYWEGKQADEIKPREGAVTLETVAETMETMAALRGMDYADPDRAMPAPYDLEPVHRGDLLLLSDREAAAGDLVVCFTVDGKPEKMGLIYPTEGGGLVQMDQAGVVCEIPERAAYRVVAYHIRSTGAAPDGGR